MPSDLSRVIGAAHALLEILKLHNVLTASPGFDAMHSRHRIFLAAGEAREALPPRGEDWEATLYCDPREICLDLLIDDLVEGRP